MSLLLLIESAINRYLALDPDTVEKISALQGKVMALKIKGANKTLYLYPTRSGFQLTESLQQNTKVDTTLSGSPFALFKMSLASNASSLLLKGEVQISGDTKLGHQLKNILSNIEIDWSEPLANVVGDSLSYPLLNGVKKIANWGLQTTKSISLDVSEYIQEESQVVLSEGELNNFNQQVDQLRDDVARLEEKIKQQKQH